jgi:hypothetical protein
MIGFSGDSHSDTWSGGASGPGVVRTRRQRWIGEEHPQHGVRAINFF